MWQFLIKRIGKRTAFIVGNLCVFPFLVGVFCYNDNSTVQLILFFIGIALVASGVTAGAIVPLIMLPDAADAYYLRYKTRPDALFYTIIILAPKIAQAFYAAIAQSAIA